MAQAVVNADRPNKITVPLLPHRAHQELNRCTKMEGICGRIDTLTKINRSATKHQPRPKFGVKYQDWKSEFTDNVGTPIYSATNKSWGVGREVGFDASLGIAEVVSLFAGAGYKVEWLDGINFTTFDDDDHDEPGGRGGELIHGPFARLGFRFP